MIYYDIRARAREGKRWGEVFAAQTRSVLSHEKCTLSHTRSVAPWRNEMVSCGTIAVIRMCRGAVPCFARDIIGICVCARELVKIILKN